MYPTGDKYQSDRSSSICPLGDLNNYKSETSINISSDIYVIWETLISIRLIQHKYVSYGILE